MVKVNVSFIGVGHIGRALINGYFRARAYATLTLSGPHPQNFADLAKSTASKRLLIMLEPLKTPI